MPRKIDGKTLSAHEEKVWNSTFASSGRGAVATAAVQKSRRRKKSRHVTRRKKR